MKNNTILNMNKKFINRFNNHKDDSGFSLLEMVIAMGILMIFIPTIVSLMEVAIVQRTASEVSTANLLNSNRIKIELSNDIEKATAINVVKADETDIGGYHLQLKKIDGTCKDWKVENNSLMISKNNTLSNQTEETKTGEEIVAWEVVYDKVDAVDLNKGTGKDEDLIDPFIKSSTGTVDYTFELGTEINEDDEVNTNALSGSVSSTVALTSPGDCWS